MKKLLHKLDACYDAMLWAGDKSWQEIYETCHRGDWLLWLFGRTNSSDLQRLTLAKAHCANTVRHLMKRDESLNAIDVAIRFGNGLATKEELAVVAAAAYAAYDDVYATYDAAYNTDATAAYTAAYAAAYTAYAAANADAYAADATADAAYTAYAAVNANARREYQKLTADICRKYLPIEIWNIK